MEEKKDTQNLCMGCMENKEKEGSCKCCGYDENKSKTGDHPFYLKPGTILNGRYIVGKVLGQGGFGITYIGFDKVLRRKVAIKEYFSSALASRDSSKLTIVPLKGEKENFFSIGMGLFIDEARNVAKFAKNPNIVNISDFFEENNTAYMVMEFLDGDDLSKLLKKKAKPLEVKEAVNILLPVLNALKDIHSANLYHRDISPQNIIVTHEGIPVLIDFGAARHIIGEESKSLDIILKPGYSPFEAYTAKGKIGSWTDIYGCGATLYFMITRNPPPPATDRMLKDDLVQPSDISHLKKNISAKLNDAILHSLAVRIDDRFKTVEEFQKPLKEYQDEHIDPVVPWWLTKKVKGTLIAVIILCFTLFGGKKIFFPGSYEPITSAVYSRGDCVKLKEDIEKPCGGWVDNLETRRIGKVNKVENKILYLDFPPSNPTTTNYEACPEEWEKIECPEFKINDCVRLKEGTEPCGGWTEGLKNHGTGKITKIENGILYLNVPPNNPITINYEACPEEWEAIPCP